MTVPQLLRTLSSSEITEQMAYDSLGDKDFRERLEAEIEREQTRDMTPAERTARLRRMLRGKE